MKRLIIILLGVLSGCSSSPSHDVTLQVTGIPTGVTANIVYEIGNSGWVGLGGWTTLPWSMTAALQHGPVSLTAATQSGTSGSVTVTILIDGVVWQTATVTSTGEQEVAEVSGIL